MIALILILILGVPQESPKDFPPVGTYMHNGKHIRPASERYVISYYLPESK